MTQDQAKNRKNINREAQSKKLLKKVKKSKDSRAR